MKKLPRPSFCVQECQFSRQVVQVWEDLDMGRDIHDSSVRYAVIGAYDQDKSELRSMVQSRDVFHGFDLNEFVWLRRLDHLRVMTVVEDATTQTRTAWMVSYENARGMDVSPKRLLHVDMAAKPTTPEYMTREVSYSMGKSIKAPVDGVVTMDFEGDPYNLKGNGKYAVYLNSQPWFFANQGHADIALADRGACLEAATPLEMITRYRLDVKAGEAIGVTQAQSTVHYVRYKGDGTPRMVQPRGFTPFVVNGERGADVYTRLVELLETSTEVDVDPIEGMVVAVPSDIAEEDDEVTGEELLTPRGNPYKFVRFDEIYRPHVIQLEQGGSSFYVDLRPLWDATMDRRKTDDDTEVFVSVKVPLQYGYTPNWLLPVLRDPDESSSVNSILLR